MSTNVNNIQNLAIYKIQIENSIIKNKEANIILLSYNKYSE